MYGPWPRPARPGNPFRACVCRRRRRRHHHQSKGTVGVKIFQIRPPVDSHRFPEAISSTKSSPFLGVQPSLNPPTDDRKATGDVSADHSAAVRVCRPRVPRIASLRGLSRVRRWFWCSTSSHRRRPSLFRSASCMRPTAVARPDTSRRAVLDGRTVDPFNASGDPTLRVQPGRGPFHGAPGGASRTPSHGFTDDRRLLVPFRHRASPRSQSCHGAAGHSAGSSDALGKPRDGGLRVSSRFSLASRLGTVKFSAIF